MLLTKRKLVLILFTALFLNGFSQDKFTGNLTISANYHYGAVLPEYQYFNYLVNDYVRSAGLNISKKTIGKNDWEQLFHYPEWGFSMFYSTLGNDHVFGREISAFPYFHIDMFSGKHVKIYNETGVGFGYVTKKLDLKNNYEDIAVGSHFNGHFSLKFGLRYAITDKIQLNAGASFNHFSNGNLKEPNLGINYMALYSGLGYRIGKYVQNEKNELQPHKKGHHYELTYSFGGKHTRALLEKFYFTTSGTFEFKYDMTPIFHAGLGADLFYDSSTQTEMSVPGSLPYKNIYDYRSGIHVSEEFSYNKLSIIVQEGTYLLLIDKVNHYPMYNRGVIRYRISDHLMISVAMKSHLQILDYPEFGIGYKW